ALCNSRRVHGALPFATAERGIQRQIAIASITGYDWVFIDTPPAMWVVVQEAIRAATLVLIPARPGFLDLDAIRETVKACRDWQRLYAVVLNAAPAPRNGRDAPSVVQARAWLAEHNIPVWGGQISQRAGFALTLAGGASAGEGDSGSFAAAEISALWAGLTRAVEVAQTDEVTPDAALPAASPGPTLNAA